MPLVLGALLGAVIGGVIGAVATPWLRRGGHRYEDETEDGRMPLGRFRAVVPFAIVAAALVGAGALTLDPVTGGIVGLPETDSLGAGPVRASDVARGLVCAALAAQLVVLAAVDVDVHRLPNAFTVRFLVGLPIVLGVLALLGGDWGPWLRALGGGLALGTVYLLLVLAGRGTGMGLGDLKLAPTLGMALGYFSWSHVVLGGGLGFVLGGLAAAFLLLARRGGRATHLAYGPWMIAGALVVLALPAVGRALG